MKLYVGNFIASVVQKANTEMLSVRQKALQNKGFHGSDGLCFLAGFAFFKIVTKY